GDSRLNYYGGSYGTFLGATYAEEFPTKVGRLVLDGALDPTLSATALSEEQLAGFEQALDSFLSDCLQQSGCPVGPTVTEALAQRRAGAARFRSDSPIFGAYFAWGDVPCTVWPVPPTDKPHAIHAKGAAPILVVGTTRDPATPYAWAQHLASQLDSGHLLTRV